MWDGAAQGWLGTVSQYKPDRVCGIRTYVSTFHTASSFHRTSAPCHMRFATLALRQFRGSQGDGAALQTSCALRRAPWTARNDEAGGGWCARARASGGGRRGDDDACVRVWVHGCAAGVYGLVWSEESSFKDGGLIGVRRAIECRA